MMTDPLVALQYYAQLLQNNVLVWFLYAPLLLVALDLLTGVLAAVKQGIFSWKQFSTFWTKSIDPYLTIILVVYLTYLISGSAVATNIAIALGMITHASSTLGSIVQNLKELKVPQPVIQEVEQLGQQYLSQPYPFPPIPTTTSPTSTRQVLPTLGQQVQVSPPTPPIDRQITQVTPIAPPPLPDLVRTSTPPLLQPTPPVILPPPAPVPPMDIPTAPPVQPDVLPTFPSGL